MLPSNKADFEVMELKTKEEGGSFLDAAPEARHDPENGAGVPQRIHRHRKIRTDAQGFPRRRTGGNRHGAVPFHLPGGGLQLAGHPVHAQRQDED